MSGEISPAVRTKTKALKSRLKEKLKSEIRDEVMGHVEKKLGARKPGDKAPVSQTTWAETGLQALKAWRGGSVAPMWAKLLTYGPLLILGAWVLYSWNRSARQLENSQNELAKLQADKARKQIEAVKAANEVERRKLRAAADALGRAEEKKLEEIKELAVKHAEDLEVIEKIEDWNDVEGAW